jgi:hypothetical protein
VSAKGSRTLTERVTHHQGCQPPKTASQLRRFLGMMNVYRQLLFHAAAIQAPLHDVLSGSRFKSSHRVTWTPELHKSFKVRKTKLSCSKLLVHPYPFAALAFISDDFISGMYAVLQQRVKNAWQTFAFFSKKLNPAQQNSCSYLRDLLTIYESVKRFDHMVESRQFVIFTDNKPITYVI